MQAGGYRYILHNSRLDHFKIWNLSDIHMLSRGCAENDIRRDVGTILCDPYSFWLGGGDYAEFIGSQDKRFDPSSVAPWVPLEKLGDIGKYSMEVVRDLFRPIKHKCLGLLMGNHEYAHLLHNAQQGLHSWLCTELGVPDLGYSCMFHLGFVRTRAHKTPTLSLTRPAGKDSGTDWTVRVFAHHGAGGASTPGGKLNRLTQFMDAFDCDLFFVGHVHDNLARKSPVLGLSADGSKLVQRERMGLIAGSYLKCYTQGSSGYGERKGYRPTSLGASVAELHPESHTMRAAI